MTMSAPTFGSHAPADVSQWVLLPLVLGSIFTHKSALFIMNVPVRKSAPWPVTVAWAAGALEIVALPSMKTVPCTLSFFVALFQKSSPALVLHEYEVDGVRSIGALPAGVALLLRSRSGTP